MSPIPRPKLAFVILADQISLFLKSGQGPHDRRTGYSQPLCHASWLEPWLLFHRFPNGLQSLLSCVSHFAPPVAGFDTRVQEVCCRNSNTTHLRLKNSDRRILEICRLSTPLLAKRSAPWASPNRKKEEPDPSRVGSCMLRPYRAVALGGDRFANAARHDARFDRASIPQGDDWRKIA